MKALLYKEFKLVVHPMFYLVTLFGALLLIPQWIFFLALMYFCFITAPNMFSLAKTYKEVYFSATQPVRRRDIVKARVLTLVTLELLQLIFAAVCIVVRMQIYSIPNFFIDANFAFLGLSFVMYGIFNAVMLPIFYKTAYKIGWATIIAMTAALVFASGVEALVLLVPFFGFLDGPQPTLAHVLTLAAGILVFYGLNAAAYRLSAARFEKLDL